jgi:hypothetical protein
MAAPARIACPDLNVHHHGANEADVTEGSGGIWERLHYDWSDPEHRQHPGLGGCGG